MSENQTIIPGIPLDAEAVSPEPGGQPAAQSQTDRFESIKRIARGAYEKVVEVVKPGRGRPRKDGSPKASDTVREIPDDYREEIGDGEDIRHPGGAGGGSAVGLQSASTETLKKCIRTVVKSLLSVPSLILHGKAKAKGMDADGILAKCMVTEGELNDLSEFGEILLRKYNVDTKYAPEAVCVMVGVGIGARFATAFVDVRKAPEPKP